MVRIAISAEAFEAIARTLPLGSVGFENEVNERGEHHVWLEEQWRIGSARCGGRVRATADAILRIAAAI
jgi:hypothetical protein